MWNFKKPGWMEFWKRWGTHKNAVDLTYKVSPENSARTATERQGPDLEVPPHWQRMPWVWFVFQSVLPTLGLGWEHNIASEWQRAAIKVPKGRVLGNWKVWGTVLDKVIPWSCLRMPVPTFRLLMPGQKALRAEPTDSDPGLSLIGRHTEQTEKALH